MVIGGGLLFFVGFFNVVCLDLINESKNDINKRSRYNNNDDDYWNF